MKKEYTKDGLTIQWNPEICTHSGICARSLPNVFKPKEKPWVQMENETNEKIEEVVNRCPSKALSIKK